ncbi:MAG: PAS domain S-box protein [gamma proteobacterium symbiont of Bathyaustriella thionipta]|nr:PAS domain S-box protein [gamma proteobacterium symbiont of Bathyaustriella thionipta]
MLRVKIKYRRSWLRRIPLPVLAMLLGLLTGLAVWLVLDRIQSTALRDIFLNDLEQRLDDQARNSLDGFNNYLTRFSTTARLLANNTRMAYYLEPVYWVPKEPFEQRRYRETPPPWLPYWVRWNHLLNPGFVLLVDDSGDTREVYQLSDQTFPEQANHIDPSVLEQSRKEPFLTNIDDQLYVLVSDIVNDTSGIRMGSMIIAVPVDSNLLAASLTEVNSDNSLIAVVNADEQTVIASSNDVKIPFGASTDSLESRYFMRWQAFSEYKGLDINLQFMTLVPRLPIEQTMQSVLNLEHQQRLIQAAVLILVFTLIILLVSSRITRALKRLSRFSQKALGIQQPIQKQGNQLLILEDWVRQFIRLVRSARDDMRQQHEAAMRETVAMKSAVMQTTLDAIATIDSDGTIIEFNQSAQKMFGLDQEGVFWRPISDLFVASERPRLMAIVSGSAKRARNSGHGLPELQARRQNGDIFPVEVTALPFSLESELVYALSIHDISSRKKSEQQIQQLARFASESPSPVMRVSDLGVLLYANDASEPLLQYWGCSRQQTLPLYWRNLLDKVLQSGRDNEVELLTGEQIFSLLFAPVSEFGYVNIYARDITQVRIAEQQARSHQSELVHVCRLSTMGEMSTGIAHELNQPLAAIVNFANGCVRRIDNGAAVADIQPALVQISRQAERAGKIIKRMRGLVSRQVGQREVADINALIREVLSFIEFDIHKASIMLDLQLSENPLWVKVDLVQIEQVLMNLIKNALDAIEETDPQERVIEVQTLRQGEAVRVCVTDTAGILQAQQVEQLFDAFYTTKESGMGMGLPISQTIIQDHGGRIWAQASEASATLFCFEILASEPLNTCVGERMNED